MSDDTPLAGMWRFMRMLRVADGPDEVHKMVIARRELNRAAKRAEGSDSGDQRRHAAVTDTHGSAEPAEATT
jgi:acyl-CoA dehydrogenase